jgi:hypothetical protein
MYFWVANFRVYLFPFLIVSYFSLINRDVLFIFAIYHSLSYSFLSNVIVVVSSFVIMTLLIVFGILVPRIISVIDMLHVLSVNNELKLYRRGALLCLVLLQNRLRLFCLTLGLYSLNLYNILIYFQLIIIKNI